MNLSVASSVFVNYSIQDTISLVAQAGYNGIDFWGGRPHVYRQDYPQPELERLRKFLKTCNLTAVSLMPAFYRYPHSLSLPNEVVRQDSLDYMRQCADNAVILGAKILLVVPGHTLYGQHVEDARLRLLDSIDWICRYVSQYELSLGLEADKKMLCGLVNTTRDGLHTD